LYSLYVELVCILHSSYYILATYSNACLPDGRTRTNMNIHTIYVEWYLRADFETRPMTSLLGARPMTQKTMVFRKFMVFSSYDLEKPWFCKTMVFSKP
jgi:hypothetical protein